MMSDVKNAFEEVAELTQAVGKMTQPKNKQGFASMEPRLVRELAAKGGKAVHAQGKAHVFDSESGRKAALKSWENKRARGEAL